MKKAMIQMMMALTLSVGALSQVEAQAFKAALYHDEYGTIRVVEQKEGNSFDLVYQVPEEKYVKVNILNEEKQVVFTESFRNRGTFRRPYNLDKLPKGKYTFQVKGSLGTYTQLVTVE